MTWNRRRKNIAAARPVVARRSLLERLENRQLMSATVDLRVASNGGKSATVSSVGQVVDLQVWVTIAGKQSGSNDGFQSVTGSILGTPSNSGSIIGNMKSSVTPDYTAFAAQDGTPKDLNGDGGLDIGSNDNSVIAGFFNPRAGGILQDGTVSGNTQSFMVGTLTYTVSKLNSGGPTSLNFRVRTISGGSFEAVWLEDGVKTTDESGTLQVGSPVTISNGNVVTTGSISGSVSKVVSGSTSGFASATVYLDSNSNGTLDSGEKTAVTNSAGAFTFSGLTAGTYHVREVVPSGYTQTSPTSSPTNVTLATGQNVTGINFTDTAASTAGKASISGNVFGDTNSDGKWQSTEKGVAGVTVYLDSNKNGVLDTSETRTTTASNGSYSFTGLAAGTYRVREVLPSGARQTTVAFYDSTLSSTTAATNKNFGNAGGTTSTGSIAGTINKIVSGVTSAFSGVTVYLDSNNNGALDSTEQRIVTGSSGTYAFAGLAAGTYHIREVVPSGYTQTSPSSSPINVMLATGQSVTGENFTDTASSTVKTGTISGFVFADANGDGKWQSTEKVITNATIFLDTNKNGVKDSGETSAVTGSNGQFSFGNLAAGNYRVREVVPSGKKLTTAAFYDVTLTAGTTLANKNFGNQ